MKEKLHLTKKFEKLLGENKGITLIALIITVIVMLILAGITLSSITGTEGLFSKTESARNKYIHSSVYESLQVLATNYHYDRYSGKTNKSLISTLLEMEVIKPSTKNEKEYIINVEKISELSEKKMTLGNGTDEETDVYKLVPSNLLAKVGALSIANLSLSSTTTEYNVVYCGKAGEAPVILGSLYDSNTGYDSDIKDDSNTEDDSNTGKINWDECFNYMINEDDEVEILGFNLDKFETEEVSSEYSDDYIAIVGSQILMIPSELDGKAVTKVSFNDNILADNHLTVSDYTSNDFIMFDVEKIVFPSSVKIIDNIISSISFSDLKEVILPENLETIGEKAFYSEGSDYNARLHIDMEIPNTVKKIESGAFHRTSINGGITLPTSLEEIGDNAFEAFNEKISGILNTKLKTIGASAFAYCTFDKDLHLPETLIEIGANAFESCGDLGNVYVPSSVKIIGDKAFTIDSEDYKNRTQYTNIYIEGKNSDEDFDSVGTDWCDTSKVVYSGKE